MKLMPNLKSAAVAKALEAVQDKKIIVLKNAKDAFSGFSDPEVSKRAHTRSLVAAVACHGRNTKCRVYAWAHGLGCKSHS